MVPILVLAAFVCLGVWLVFRAPDPPGMVRPSGPIARGAVGVLVGVPFGMLLGFAALFVVSLFTGPLV